MSDIKSLRVKGTLDGYDVWYDQHVTKGESDAIKDLINKKVIAALEKVESKAYEQRVRNDASSLGSHMTVVHINDIQDIKKEYESE